MNAILKKNTTKKKPTTMWGRKWREKRWQTTEGSQHNDLNLSQYKQQANGFQMSVLSVRGWQRGPTAGVVRLVEWICFSVGRLVSLCGAQKPVNENFCGTTHRKQVKPHISIWKFNLSSAPPNSLPPPPNTQEDLPQVTSQMQPFRAPQGGSDPVLGEGKDLTQRVFSGPELEVQRDTCLWLWTPGRAHRNCCWMWAPSRCCKAKETWTQEGCV